MWFRFIKCCKNSRHASWSNDNELLRLEHAPAAALELAPVLGSQIRRTLLVSLRLASVSSCCGMPRLYIDNVRLMVMMTTDDDDSDDNELDQ